MQPDAIQIMDPMRILMGNVPWTFLLECIFRFTFLYALILASIRLMGKRMVSALSRSDLAALASIAGASGVPMLGPDEGLLPTAVAALVIVSVHRGISYASFRSEGFETFLHGRFYTMVVDGQLILENMSKSVLSRDRLFSQLRAEGIDNLGQVERVYMEANGTFTIIKQAKPRPGLSTAPAFDQDYINQQPKVPNAYVCSRCGALKEQQIKPNEACHKCGCTEWLRGCQALNL